MVYQVKPAITIKLKTRTVHCLIDVVHALHLGNVMQSPTTRSGKSASMVGGQSVCYRKFCTGVGRTLKGLGHAILGNFSIDQVVIELLTEITK